MQPLSDVGDPIARGPCPISPLLGTGQIKMGS